MPPARPRSSPGLGCHPTCTSSSSRLLCRFLHVPPYILGEGEPRPLPSSTRVAVGGSVWDNAWQTPLSAAFSHLSGKRPALGWGSDSRPRPLPGPQAGALRREEEGEVGGAGRPGASLRGKYFGCGPRGAGRLAPLCARLCASRLCALRPALPAAEPAPPAPSRRGAGRGCGAGGTSDSALRAWRLHGAQCQRAEPAARTARRGPPQPAGRCCPSPSRSPRPAADGAPAPAAPAPVAAAAAETMDAGAAPRKHSRCRASPVAAPGARRTRGGAAALGGGSRRHGEGARAAPSRPGCLGLPVGRAASEVQTAEGRPRSWRGRAGMWVRDCARQARGPGLSWRPQVWATPCELSSPGLGWMSQWGCDPVLRRSPAQLRPGARSPRCLWMVQQGRSHLGLLRGAGWTMPQRVDLAHLPGLQVLLLASSQPLPALAGGA